MYPAAIRRPAHLLAPALLVVCAVLPAPARAGGLTPAPASALDLALGGAGIALAEGAAALWLNPAAIDDARFGAAVTLSLASDDTSLVRDSAVINQALPEARDAAGPRVAPAVAVVAPLWRGRLWLSLGYHQALRHDSKFLPPESDRVEESARYLGRSLALVDHRVAMGLSAAVGMLRLGVAIEVGTTRLRHARALWAGYAVDSPQLENDDYDSSASLALDGPSFAARVGLALRPWRWLHLAAMAVLPGVRRLSGTLSLTSPTQPPAGYTAITARDGHARLDLDSPGGLDAGVAVDAGKRLTFAAAVRWRRWSSLDAARAAVTDAGYDLSGPGPRSVDVESIGLGVHLRDALSMHLGAELRLLDGFLRARVGYGYQRGMTPPSAPSSVVFDPPRHTVAGGLEVRAGYVAIAAAVAYTFGVQLHSAGDGTQLENPLDAAITRAIGAGRYEASSTRVVLEVRVSL